MRGEMIGPSIHDGARIEVPFGTVAVVLVSRDHDGNLNASVGVHGKVDHDQLAELLCNLGLSLA